MRALRLGRVASRLLAAGLFGALCAAGASGGAGATSPCATVDGGRAVAADVAGAADAPIASSLTARAGGSSAGARTDLGNSARISCVRLPAGARQGPQRWLTLHAVISVVPADLSSIDATIALRVGGWDAVQSAVAGGSSGVVSVETATASGIDDRVATTSADGTFLYEVTNYLPAASVHPGDVAIALAVDGRGVRAATAEQPTLEWTDVPPSTVVSAIDRSSWPAGTTPTGRSIVLPVVVSTQQAAVAITDVVVDVRVEGAPADVHRGDTEVVAASSHVRRTSLTVTPRAAGASSVVVTVRIPSLGFEHVETLQLEARRAQTSSATWLFVLAGIAAVLAVWRMNGRNEIEANITAPG